MSDPIALARDFLAQDPDPSTRAELSALLAKAEGGDSAAHKSVAERFSGRLKFGTAGLRGEMGAGLARMNRVVVLQATWGLGTYLLERGPKEGFDAKKQGVVIGFDGRRNSRQLAEDAASVLSGLGIPVHIAQRPVPTPLCGFACKELSAAAGIVVTASHNPPQDNGYKVYWANAAQIVPPHDSGIAACIDRAPRVPDLARLDVFAQVDAGLRRPLSDEVVARYLEAIERAALHPGVGEDAKLRIVYTAMHGVGNDLVLQALSRAGFSHVATVPSQADPDGTFPTVKFPNPEEEGALDIALALARETKADLLLANDPDADRIAVCLPGRDKGAGQDWVALSGNDVGVLLGADAIEHADTGGREKLVITTLVSSTMLGRVAKDLGAAYEETLTGFKWIANAAVEGEASGKAFVLGYEEALGVSVGPIVRDKDGISAAVRVAELVAFLKQQGKTLHDRLDELAVRHGLSRADQWSIVLPGAEGKARIDGLMRDLRNEPPASLSGSKVTRRLDLNKRPGEGNPAFEGSEMPPADVLVFWAEDGTRLIARPSGTEPKLKFYLELTERVGAPGELPASRARLDQRLQAVRAEVMERLGL